MKRFIIGLSIAISVIWGCNSDPSNLVANNGTSISGAIMLYNEFGKQRTDLSGVLVKAGDITATTNNNGMWILPNVPAGTYNITFTKDGFDSTVIFNYSVDGTGTKSIEQIHLVEPSTVTITNIYTKSQVRWTDSATGLEHWSGTDLYCTLNNLEEKGESINLLLQYSTDSLLVGSSNYIYEFKQASPHRESGLINGVQREWNHTFPPAMYNPIETQGSTKIYMQMQAMPLNKYTVDGDGKRHYQGLGAPSQIVSFYVN